MSDDLEAKFLPGTPIVGDRRDVSKLWFRVRTRLEVAIRDLPWEPDAALRVAQLRHRKREVWAKLNALAAASGTKASQVTGERQPRSGASGKKRGPKSKTPPRIKAAIIEEYERGTKDYHEIAQKVDELLNRKGTQSYVNTVMNSYHKAKSRNIGRPPSDI
jgi:hypothetical protein